jgi:glycerate kinase
MRKINLLIAPDSFKGSISAVDISRILSNKLRESKLPVQHISVPLADGGEGSLDAINQVLNLMPIEINVKSPQFLDIDAMYLIDKQNNTAYIELAQASGLGLIKGKNDIMHSSTFGTGQLIKDAIEKGITKMVLFLGGSATCDAGLGIVDALGIKFRNFSGDKIIPSALKIAEIESFNISGSILNGRDLEMLLAVDVNNPFYGINGASYVYSPQKGANKEQVEFLDKGLRNIANVIERQKGINLQMVPGSGAAGGTAGGLHALLGAKIIAGIDLVFNITGLEEKVKQADLVISGEGKIDYQSLNNKLLSGISRLCKKYDKKFWAICGYFDGDEKLKQELFINKVYSLAQSVEEINDSVMRASEKLSEISDRIVFELEKGYS